MKKVDVIVIGSGQGGVPLAVKLAHRGKQVVLFERRNLGGSCLNFGCYPSKAFLGAAFTIPRRDRNELLGIRTETQLDFSKLMDRVRGKRDSGYIRKSLDRSGATTVMAEASFVGERQVTAGGETYEAGLVVVNTGNGPAVPPVPGLNGSPYMTYMNFWDLKELPPHIILLGGGYIGVELGQGLARLGSEVQIVELAPRIIAREENDVSETIREALEADGVRFHLGRKAERVDHDQDSGKFTITLDNNLKLEAEAMLVVSGQKPNTAELDAAAGGIELSGKGYIKVNDRFETSCPGVYAIGDVTGQPAFTHVAWEDHRRLLSILDGGDRRQADRVLGYAFFTDPEVGRCGLTLEEAKRQGIDARAETLALEHVARPWLVDETRGFMRLVIDNADGRLIGATLIGPRAGDLVHVVLDLMEAGADWQLLERAVHIHPSFAEGLPTTARKFRKRK